MARKLRATQAKIAQFVFHDALARRIQESVGGRRLQRLEAFEQLLVLRQLGVVLRDLGQVFVVDFTQFRRIHHRVQMANLSPGPHQLLIGVL
jgi:hypothetical protein